MTTSKPARGIFVRLWRWLRGLFGKRRSALPEFTIPTKVPLPPVLVKGKRLPLPLPSEETKLTPPLAETPKAVLPRKSPTPTVVKVSSELPPEKPTSGTPAVPSASPRDPAATQQLVMPRQISKELPEGFELSFHPPKAAPRSPRAEIVIPSRVGAELPILPADMAPKTVVQPLQVESRSQLDQLLKEISKDWKKP